MLKEESYELILQCFAPYVSSHLSGEVSNNYATSLMVWLAILGISIFLGYIF